MEDAVIVRESSLNRLLLWTARGAGAIAVVTLVLWTVSLWCVPSVAIAGTHVACYPPVTYLRQITTIRPGSAPTPLLVPTWTERWETAILVTKPYSSGSILFPQFATVGPVPINFRCRTIVGLFGAIAVGCLITRHYRRDTRRGFAVPVVDRSV